MRRLIGQRAAMFAAGVATVMAVAGPASPEVADITGTVEFAGGEAIPKGEVRIYIEGSDVGAPQGDMEAKVRSDGGLKTVDFSLAQPATPSAMPSLRVIARLERDDGWLLARGSARAESGSPVRIILRTVMY